MMMHEFIERTGYTPSFEEYKLIEESYYEFDGYKDDFCKWWKKANKSGEWKKELRLRQKLSDVEHDYREQLREKEEMLEWYRAEFQKGYEARNKLKAIENLLK